MTINIFLHFLKGAGPTTIACLQGKPNFSSVCPDREGDCFMWNRVRETHVLVQGNGTSEAWSLIYNEPCGISNCVLPFESPELCLCTCVIAQNVCSEMYLQTLKRGIVRQDRSWMSD